MKYVIRPIQVEEYKEPTEKEVEEELGKQFLDRKMRNRSNK